MIFVSTLTTRAGYSDFRAGERGWLLAFKGCATLHNADFGSNYAGEYPNGRFQFQSQTAGYKNFLQSRLDTWPWTVVGRSDDPVTY